MRLVRPAATRFKLPLSIPGNTKSIQDFSEVGTSLPPLCLCPCVACASTVHSSKMDHYVNFLDLPTSAVSLRLGRSSLHALLMRAWTKTTSNNRCEITLNLAVAMLYRYHGRLACLVDLRENQAERATQPDTVMTLAVTMRA